MLDQGSRVLEQSVELPIEISPSGWVWSHQQPLELSNLDLENRFPAVLDLYKARGLRSLLVMPMNTAHSRLGTLGFGSGHLTKYDEDTLRFLTRITGLVALAVENSSIKQALATEEEQLRNLTAITGELTERGIRAQEELQKERKRTQTLLEINSALVASRLEEERPDQTGRLDARDQESHSAGGDGRINTAIRLEASGSLIISDAEISGALDDATFQQPDVGAQWAAGSLLPPPPFFRKAALSGYPIARAWGLKPETTNQIIRAAVLSVPGSPEFQFAFYHPSATDTSF